jgi:4-amino-4-deoxy-L-arabinose transferase-like glycosyltransferase
VLRRRALPLFILIYYLLFVAVRMLASDSAGYDESEQIILSQAVLGGYGSQPPLYPWCVGVISSVLGTGILALTLFKAAILSAAVMLVFRVATSITLGPALAAAVGLSVFLLPEIAWESMRDRSNTVLLFALCALTFHQFLRLHQRRRWSDHVRWGACAGLGMLTKYNFILFLGPLCAAALMDRDTRQTVASWKVVFALLAAIVVSAPHAVWVIGNLDLATAETLSRLHPGRGGWALATVRGLAAIPTQSIAFLGPFLLVCLVVAPATLGRALRSLACDGEESSRAIPWRGLIRHTIILAWGVVAGLVVAFRFTTFDARWFLPFLFLFPLYVFLHATTDDPSRSRIVALQRLAVAAALLAVVILPLRMIVTPVLGVYENQHHPYSDLAKAIMREGFRRGQVVLGGDRVVAGNFKIHLDAAVAASPDVDVITPLAKGGRLDLSACDQVLIAWQGEDDAMPEVLRSWLETLPVAWQDGETRLLSLPYKHARRGDAYHLRYIVAEIVPKVRANSGR